MKKIIATIIISLALLATAVTSFWFMIDTNLQLSDVRDRIEEVKLLINDKPENLKNKEDESKLVRQEKYWKKEDF